MRGTVEVEGWVWLAGSIDGAPDAPEMAGACVIAVVPPWDLHCVMG
jgi:hypothetical protein